jgi:hypothetical protein
MTAEVATATLDFRNNVQTKNEYRQGEGVFRAPYGALIWHV